MEDESDEVKAIIGFVKEKEKTRNPAQWKYIREHFRWSQDKWVKNWKRAALYMEKKRLPEGGYPRYFVKKDFSKVASNMLSIQRIVSQISKEQVQEIEIPWLRLQETIGKYVKDSRQMFKNMAWDEAHKQSDLSDKLNTQQEKQKGKSRISRLFKGTAQNQNELSLIEPLLRMANWFKYIEASEKLHEARFETSLLTLASHTKINVVYDKDEPLPILDDSDIVHFLNIFAKNVKAKIKKPWHIVATFHIPEEDYIQDRANEVKA